MDINMPYFSGYQVTKEIRSTDNPNTNATIIAMTAFAMDRDKEKCFQAGMDDHISKPMKQDQLRKILNKWLKEKAVTSKK